jgi:hypothetical protein
MRGKSTILIEKETIAMLKKAKQHPRQTYDELIRNMADTVIRAKRQTQYDEFLHKIQRQKMQELWDNSEDDAWERA